MRQVFAVLRSGATVRTFDAYADVQQLVSRLCPDGEYRPWFKGLDGRLWREVRVGNSCFLTINTILTADELAQAGAN